MGSSTSNRPLPRIGTSPSLIWLLPFEGFFDSCLLVRFFTELTESLLEVRWRGLDGFGPSSEIRPLCLSSAPAEKLTGCPRDPNQFWKYWLSAEFG